MILKNRLYLTLFKQSTILTDFLIPSFLFVILNQQNRTHKTYCFHCVKWVIPFSCRIFGKYKLIRMLLHPTSTQINSVETQCNVSIYKPVQRFSDINNKPTKYNGFTTSTLSQRLTCHLSDLTSIKKHFLEKVAMYIVLDRNLLITQQQSHIQKVKRNFRYWMAST